MQKDKEKTVVIFRRFKNDSTIIALFPYIKWNSSSTYCSSYMHVGQHGEADYVGLLDNTVLAKPSEYKALKKELESIGYNLIVRKRKGNRK
jgi:hypothetical protein